MPTFNISQATAGKQSTVVDDYSVTLKETDGVTEQKETRWSNNDWSKWYGYASTIPDVSGALRSMALWTVGTGWTADDRTTVILDSIRGWGNESFTDIMRNLIICMRVGGDAFAEIIRDDDGILINLKVLDPGSMDIIVNPQGIIIRYEQRLKAQGKDPRKIEPNKILHLCHNRFADNIHGTSDLEAVEQRIKANEESFKDTKKLMHHQVRPFILWKLKTDDQAKITAFIKKIDAARNLGEDMFIPDDEDMVTHEIVSTPLTSQIFTWRDDLRNGFYRNIGLPQIVAGAGGMSTESESKAILVTHEVTSLGNQKFITENFWNQVSIKFKLKPPPSFVPALQQDQAKDANQGLEFQQGDLQAGVAR